MEHRLRTLEGYFQVIDIYCVPRRVLSDEQKDVPVFWKGWGLQMLNSQKNQMGQCETFWGEFYPLRATETEKERSCGWGQLGKFYGGCGSWFGFKMMARLWIIRTHKTMETLWAKNKPQERKALQNLTNLKIKFENTYPLLKLTIIIKCINLIPRNMKIALYYYNWNELVIKLKKKISA